MVDLKSILFDLRSICMGLYIIYYNYKGISGNEHSYDLLIIFSSPFQIAPLKKDAMTTSQIYKMYLMIYLKENTCLK